MREAGVLRVLRFCEIVSSTVDRETRRNSRNRWGVSIVLEGGRRGVRVLCLSVHLSRNRIAGSVVGDQTATGLAQRPFRTQWMQKQWGPGNEKTTEDQIVRPQLRRCRDGKFRVEYGRTWGAIDLMLE